MTQLPKMGRPSITGPSKGRKYLKTWVVEESIRCGVGAGAIYMRLHRGKYPGMKREKLGTKTVIVLNPEECFSPKKERVYVQDVKQEDGEIWIRVSAANAKRGTPPTMCIMAGDILILEQIPNTAKVKDDDVPELGQV